MATGQDQVNPAAVTQPFSTVGKELTFCRVPAGAAINAKTGPGSTIEAIINAVQTCGTILHMGAVHSSNQKIDFILEGSIPLTGADKNSLTAAIQALGTVDSVDLSGVTVVAVTTDFNV